MRRVLLASLVICMLALLSTLSISVHATPPTSAWGTWTYILKPGYPVVTKVADGNTFKYGEESGTWTGTFEGTSDDAFTLVMHPEGFVTCEGRIHFTGSVNDASGELFILFVGKRTWSPPGPWSGQWVIISGTGYLANLHGQGTWSGPPFNLAYSGQIHFDPA